MELALVVAAAENGCIGREGDLPWRLPDDLKHFKQITMGSPVIMGRKTWESIGRPLPGRLNIVVTRQLDYHAEGVVVVNTLDDARLQAIQAGADVGFVIGGAALYAEAVSGADIIHLTRVHASVDGDTFLPEIPWEDFERVESEHHPADERHAFAFTFETWQRRGH